MTKETKTYKKSEFKQQIENSGVREKINAKKENLKKFYGEDWKNYIG